MVRSIWLVPALGVVMVFAAVIASQVPPAEALAARRVTPAPRFAEPPPPLPPPPPPAILTGIAECDVLAATMERIARCPKMPAETRTAVRSAIDQLVTSTRQLPESGRLATAQACEQAKNGVLQALRTMDC